MGWPQITPIDTDFLPAANLNDYDIEKPICVNLCNPWQKKVPTAAQFTQNFFSQRPLVPKGSLFIIYSEIRRRSGVNLTDW
jgi:hypothetical protein